MEDKKEMKLPEGVIQQFDEYCKKRNLTGKEKEKKLDFLTKLIETMKYEPGEAVGVIAAQSISEPATQMTMRSYTLASQSDRMSKVTQGLPRLIEIFDTRKTFEKTMMIYLLDKYNSKEGASKIASMIQNANVLNLVDNDSINLVTMQIELTFSNKSDRDMVKEVLTKYIKNSVISLKDDKVIIKPDDDGIENLRKVLKKVLAYHVSGVKDIHSVIVIKDGEDWVIQTSGSNLKGVLELDGVDVERTYCNDPHQVAEVLGIDAARNLIINESKKTLGEQGLEIDSRHLVILADIMTVNGLPRAIGRYGVSGQKNSVLARANFEETKKHLVNATFLGEKDMLRSVVENIMIGQVAPFGTGLVDLSVDMDKLKENLKK